MFTIMYFGLVIMCLLPKHLFNKREQFKNFNNICISGIVCSSVCLAWTLYKFFLLFKAFSSLRSVMNHISEGDPLIEEMMWALNGDEMRSAEGTLNLCTVFLIGYIIIAILSVKAIIKYCNYRNLHKYKECPKCCERIMAGATLCHFCGYEFDEHDNIYAEKKMSSSHPSPWSCYSNMFKNFFNFNDNVSRFEYWMAILIHSFITLFIFFILLFSNADSSMLIEIFILYLIITSFAIISMVVRRLNSVGKKWFVLLIPILCIILAYVFASLFLYQLNSFALIIMFISLIYITILTSKKDIAVNSPLESIDEPKN